MSTLWFPEGWDVLQSQLGLLQHQARDAERERERERKRDLDDFDPLDYHGTAGAKKAKKEMAPAANPNEALDLEIE